MLATRALLPGLVDMDKFELIRQVNQEFVKISEDFK